MKYLRRFQTGTGGSDPRSKWVAVYKCESCGNEEWITMGDPLTFRTGNRVCPKCQALEPEDKRKSLEVRRSELEQQQARIKSEIDRIIEELDRLPVEEDSKEV